MHDNPEGGKSDPTVDDRRRCKKNYSPSVLSDVDKRTKEGCNQATKWGQFTVGEAGKGQFL